MPEMLSPELIQLRDDCAEFATQHLLTHAEQPAPDARDQVRAAAKAAGLFAMTQPTAFGGSAAGQLALCVARAVSYTHLTLPTTD